MPADWELFQDSDLPGWYADAACAGADTALWFASTGDSYAEALAVCDVCQVRAACLEHALTIEGDAGATHRYGIWGGTTPTERAALRRRQAA